MQHNRSRCPCQRRPRSTADEQVKFQSSDHTVLEPCRLHVSSELRYAGNDVHIRQRRPVPTACAFVRGRKRASLARRLPSISAPPSSICSTGTFSLCPTTYSVPVCRRGSLQPVVPTASKRSPVTSALSPIRADRGPFNLA